MKLATPQELDPKSLEPYENNARTITEQAIKAVMESITKFGFVQPIVVNPSMSILVGHTRHAAAMRLKRPTVPVIIAEGLTAEEEREYRLIDNKTGEMTSWDLQALQLELREFDRGILEEYFPDIDLGVEQTAAETISDDILRRTEEKVMTINQQSEMAAHETKVECPSCAGQFSVRTKSLPGLTWDDFSALLAKK